MSISRRGFIGGIVAAVASGEALIRLADPREQALIKTGEPAFLPPYGELGAPPRNARFGQMYVAIIGEKETYEGLGWCTDVNIECAVDSVIATEFGMSVEHWQTIGPRHRRLDVRAIMEHQKGHLFG